MSMIARHRSTLICVHDNKVLAFHAEDPSSKQKYIFLPGGKIEENESAVASALRECLEETGYEAKIISGFHLDRTYDFPWDGRIFRTRTEFFAAHLRDPSRPPLPVDDAAYHRGVVWIPTEKIPHIFAYQKDILEAITAAVEFLKKSALEK